MCHARPPSQLPSLENFLHLRCSEVTFCQRQHPAQLAFVQGAFPAIPAQLAKVYSDIRESHASVQMLSVRRGRGLNVSNPTPSSRKASSDWPVGSCPICAACMHVACRWCGDACLRSFWKRADVRWEKHIGGRGRAEPRAAFLPLLRKLRPERPKRVYRPGHRGEAFNPRMD